MASSTTYLIDDPNYAFLKDLGLERTNLGVYNGKWTGSGPIVKSVDPATGNVIAEVKTGTAADYETCAKNAVNAYKTWSNIPGENISIFFFLFVNFNSFIY